MNVGTLNFECPAAWHLSQSVIRYLFWYFHGSWKLPVRLLTWYCLWCTWSPVVAPQQRHLLLSLANMAFLFSNIVDFLVKCCILSPFLESLIVSLMMYYSVVFQGRRVVVGYDDKWQQSLQASIRQNCWNWIEVNEKQRCQKFLIRSKYCSS